MGQRIKYRIYCETEEGQIAGYTTQDPPPTLCPHNPAHTVIADSKCIIEIAECYNNFEATTNPTANDDIDAGYSVGSRWVNNTLGFEFVCVDNTADAAVWLLLSRETPDIHLSFGGIENNYCKTSSTSWDVLRRFVFRGTDIIGTPVAFKVIAAVSANTADIRLYDVLNSTIIGGMVNIDNDSWNILTDSSLENLPTSESVFEVQAKVDNGNDTVYLSGGSLLF